jgi:hypothetical protein
MELLCMHSLLSILFSNVLNQCSSLTVRISHPYKPMGNIILIRLNNRILDRKPNDSQLHDTKHSPTRNEILDAKPVSTQFTDSAL